MHRYTEDRRKILFDFVNFAPIKRVIKDSKYSGMLFLSAITNTLDKVSSTYSATPNLMLLISTSVGIVWIVKILVPRSPLKLSIVTVAL